MKELSKMSVGDDSHGGIRSPIGFSTKSQSAISALSGGLGCGPSTPTRRMERNKSGPQGRSARSGRAPPSRAPPRRSHSSKIGRPAFDPALPDASAPIDQQHGKSRGVNRSQSNRVKGTTRNAPVRTGSFHRRRVPDRASSSSSLRRTSSKRQQQLSAASATNSTAETDDVSVSDSVYTSISIQTMDSIAIRKKQIPLSQGKVGVNRDIAIEFNDAINGMGQADCYNDDIDDGEIHEYEEEMSVFSESWCSSESYEILSDYEEGEMDGAILEDDEDKDEVDDENEMIISHKNSENQCSSAE